MKRVIPGLDYLAVILSSSVNTGQLRLVRSIRLARALRGIRIVWLFEYVGAVHRQYLGDTKGGKGAPWVKLG